MRTSPYFEARGYSPSKGHPLHPYVRSIFRARAWQAYRNETILPTGSVDILFNLGEPLRILRELPTPEMVFGRGAWVTGISETYVTTEPVGQVDLLGVSLHAEACTSILRLPAHELANRCVEGTEVFADLSALAERLSEMPGFEEQCEHLIRWTMCKLQPGRATHSVLHACRLLRSSAEGPRVSETARELAMSPRHLRRLLVEYVGVSPAQYVRLQRFAGVLKAMERPTCGGGRPLLSEVAHAAGFFDQPHFNREFRSFAAMTPAEYRRRQRRSPIGHVFAEAGPEAVDDVRLIQSIDT